MSDIYNSVILFSLCRTMPEGEKRQDHWGYTLNILYFRFVPSGEQAAGLVVGEVPVKGKPDSRW
jgi:hypothetical protein